MIIISLEFYRLVKENFWLCPFARRKVQYVNKFISVNGCGVVVFYILCDFFIIKFWYIFRKKCIILSRGSEKKKKIWGCRCRQEKKPGVQRVKWSNLYCKNYDKKLVFLFVPKYNKNESSPINFPLIQKF